MQISKTDSERITILRTLALTSVVSAHTSSVILEDKITVFCSNFLSAYGSIGVIAFFILSGYLFELQNKSLIFFWKSKIAMLIPWLLCGTMNYLYTALRKDGVSIIGWTSALLVHSHYYYMSVLFILYGLHQLLKCLFQNRTAFHVILAVLSVISIVLTQYGIIRVYPYINFMNWAVYFSVGCILAHKNLIFLYRGSNLNAGAYGVIIALILIGYNICFQRPLSYWSPISTAVILILTYMMWNATWNIQKCRRVKNYFMLVGKYSFSIYLVHMPFAGVITNLTNSLPYSGGLVFVRPILVVGITFLCILMCEYIAKKLRIEKWFRLCVGIR